MLESLTIVLALLVGRSLRFEMPRRSVDRLDALDNRQMYPDLVIVADLLVFHGVSDGLICEVGIGGAFA